MPRKEVMDWSGARTEKQQADIERQARQEASEVITDKTQRKYRETGKELGEGRTGMFTYKIPAMGGEEYRTTGKGRLEDLERRKRREKEGIILGPDSPRVEKED